MKEFYSKEETYSIKIGFYVIALIAVISALYIMNQRDFKHADEGAYYPVYARFGRTDGLQVGNMVRMAGINIGRVTDAKLDDRYKAVLTLEVREGIKIPDDSSASIVSESILGSKYIEIEPGGSEDFLPKRGEFSYTQDAMVLEELLDRIIGLGKSKRKDKAKDEEMFDE